MEQCVLGISYTTPVSGWLSSPFGYREHPIEGEEKFHRGLDIAAPAGTDIGRFCGWNGQSGGREQFFGKVYHAQPQWRADDDLWALQ